MQGSHDSYGRCSLKWDTQVEKLYSPDGTQHLLPCDNCGQPCWVMLNTVAVVCDRCAEARKEGEHLVVMPIRKTGESIELFEHSQVHSGCRAPWCRTRDGRSDRRIGH